LQQVFSALRSAESAGIAAVAGGTAEANFAVLTGLYLAIFVGFLALATAVIRMFTAKKRSSPPGLYYLLPGLLALVPAGLLWYAESLIIDVLLGVGSPESGEIAAPDTITMLLATATISVPVILIVLAVLGFVPFSARPGGKVGPTIALLVIGLLFISTAMAFQYRTIFLYQIREERGATNVQPSNLRHENSLLR
jgi:hypothetical protein